MGIRLKPCHIENKLNIIKKSASFFIAVTPLCAPYNRAWIPVTVIIAVSVLAFYYLSNGKIHFSFEKRMVPLILYVATVILLSYLPTNNHVKSALTAAPANTSCQ